MAYNISKLMDRLAEMSGDKKKKDSLFKQWKPSLTEDGKSKTFNVRLMPYSDQNGQPIQEVMFYNDPALAAYRIVASGQFGLEDPIATSVAKLRKDRSVSWDLIKKVLPKSKFFVPVFVREEPEKGVQVWELSQNSYKEIVGLMVSEDLRDEDVTDPVTGRDFQVAVTSSGKIYEARGKKYPVNDIKIIVRQKQSKLSMKPGEADHLLKSVPNIYELFKGEVKSTDELHELYQDFQLRSGKEKSDNTSTQSAEFGTNHTGVSHEVSPEVVDETTKSIQNTFDDIDSM